MDTAKIFGWVLCVLGIVIIIFTLLSSYKIFTGKSSIPIIFKVEGKNSEQAGNQSAQEDKLIQDELQKEIEGLIQQQLSQLIPTDLITKIMNLITWSILAGILIFGGGKISELGINLIKK